MSHLTFIISYIPTACVMENVWQLNILFKHVDTMLKKFEMQFIGVYAFVLLLILVM